MMRISSDPFSTDLIIGTLVDNGSIVGVRLLLLIWVPLDILPSLVFTLYLGLGPAFGHLNWCLFCSLWGLGIVACNGAHCCFWSLATN